jgi:hypothetical protein
VPCVAHCFNTHAYVVRDPHLVAEMLGAPPPNIHVDQMLGYRLDLVRYAVNPPTTGQRGGVVSDISGVLRSEDDYFVNRS